MSREPKLISLFTGAGGLDFGFEAAGFRTCVAIDNDRECCETIRRNRAWPVIERDILRVPTEEVLETAGVHPDEVDVLIGGPPCQPFSKSGYWARGDTRRLADPRAGTLDAYLRIVEDVLPRVFVLENVEGLAYSTKNEGVRFVLERIGAINRAKKVSYVVTPSVLCAADYGVPQLRYRFFLVGTRCGSAFRFPERTHRPIEAEQLSLGSERPLYRTAWDALGDLPAPSGEDLAMRGKWAALLPSIPEGENYLWHTDRGGGLPLFGWRRRFWSFLLKLAKDRPSWTIQAQPGPGTGPFHWANRRLSMRELCRLQTFPDDVVISGPYRAIHRQVGNAVPSLLGEVLGRAIREQLLDLPVRGALHLLPPDRSPVPAPEAVEPVPRAFRRLTGAHSPHPGTGKGHRAISWSAHEK